MKLGITRVRNEEVIIQSTLDRLKNHLDGVIAFDDASDDNTYEILRSDPFVIGVLRNMTWATEPRERMILETEQRNNLYDFALTQRPEWVLYFDADEHIYFDAINWSSQHSYFFRLFDVYITPDDQYKHFSQRNMIGCEYRDIPMLFRPENNSGFYNRLPRLYNSPIMGGTVKHFGKGISVEHWEETCDYYINHLYEVGKTGQTISDKWKSRKGKAIHTKSDFGGALIHWNERYHDNKIKLLDQ